MAQYIWTIRNTTIGDDAGIGYYTSKANAVASIRTWLTDTRTTILTDLSKINLRSRSLAHVEIVVRALGSHTHQVLEIERHHCNNGAWMVHILRQGQEVEDPELETAKDFAKQAEAAMDDPADPFWKGNPTTGQRGKALVALNKADYVMPQSLITKAEEAEIDIHLEQKVAGALGTLLSPYLEKDRARLSLKEIVEQVAELMNIHCPGRPVYSTGAITKCIIDRLASEELHMRLDGTAGYTDKRQLSYRFLATIEEALSPTAYINWTLVQVKVIPIRDCGEASGYKPVLQLRRAYH